MIKDIETCRSSKEVDLAIANKISKKVSKAQHNYYTSYFINGRWYVLTPEQYEEEITKLNNLTTEDTII